MKTHHTWGALALTAGMLLSAAPAQAQDLKIGLILSMSGPYADYGKQIQNGIHTYMAQHGDTVAGRKIQLIVKDDTGIAPAIAKRQAQELLIKDKVDILAGFDLTPNAFSVAPLATESKTPMVVMNAATSSITEKSPYIVRMSMTLPQSAWAMAQWARKENIQSAYILVADYGPGHDAQAQFKKTFTEQGGQVVGEVRTPVSTADYSPFLQRVKDSAPDALFFFVPPGSSMVALAKNFRELGLDKQGIQGIGPGDMTDENSLAALGDAALGLVTAFHYSDAHDSPENQAFVAAYEQGFPGERPNFMSVGGYDGMQLIYKALEATRGDASAEAFIAAARGLQWESPRGPVSIDPETRDIVQNEYIRKLERVDGKLQNMEFDTFAAVKDPGK
ncbi:ABC transporter substrate-binding protein [Castellaniella hirudinis]|uniref:ABC transporter substrate-binding protein n=1 Tax=Castellaniella hirudinis TaxID=1144617 RepID=UPI0039C368B7